MKNYEKLLLENHTWANQKVKDDPDYFSRLVDVQSPKYLWIGCSDSRVPPNEITQTKPGEIFIHRNIANMVVHTDLNMLSVLQYAVEVLEVEHIIVCGHYGCGGVKAALTNKSLGIIDNWLRNIKDVYRLHQNEIEAIRTKEKKVNRLIELNVEEQLYNLAKTAIVQNAWKQRRAPILHGWVYDLHDGIIKTLRDIQPNTPFEHDIYRFDNLD